MAKTNWVDPGSTEILSTHIAGLQAAVSKIEEQLDINTYADTAIPLSLVDTSPINYRIYQAASLKRNWLATPAPIIKKNAVVITTGFAIDYGAGAIILTIPATSVDVYTCDATYIKTDSTISMMDDAIQACITKEIWDPPTQITMATGAVGSPVPVGGWTAEEAIDGLFEPLRTAFPDYITRSLVGLDESGLYNIYKYVFTPEKYYEKTIILTASTHGNEYSGFYSLYLFLWNICYNWVTYPQLNYMRNRVRIVIIPHINPWGFNEGRRQNINGVDLNRQGDYAWTRYNSDNLDSGTAESGTTTSLTDTDKAWDTNEFAKTKVVISAGTGVGQAAYIKSNTATKLTLDETLAIAPDNTSQYYILNKYYKGTAPWSEAESQHFKTVLEAYPEALVYLDFHTITTTDAHYIFYCPRFMNVPWTAIRKVIDFKYIAGERIVWGTSALPTLSNYAAYTYGMMSGNPEVKNSMYGTSRDATEMTRHVWWFGNIVLQHSFLKGNGTTRSLDYPYMKHLKYNGEDSKFYYVNTYDALPRDVQLSSDGTKMYIADRTDGHIHQYTLSTAYDVSTASYASKYTDISTEESYIQGFVFKTDGTKMYIVGSTNDTVYQYTLGVAWDISTATYDTVLKDVSAQESIPTGINFSSDGTKMYIIGTQNSTIYQYTLTAWDLSTAVYSTKSYSVIAEDTAPRGIAFNNDGLICYILGSIGDKVYQYTLGVAWDISTSSYATKSLDVSLQDTFAQGMYIGDSGSKCYIVGETTAAVYQYTLSTPYDISTGSHVCNNEHHELPATNAYTSFYTTHHEFAVDRSFLVVVQGEVTVKCSRTCKIKILPTLYQSYNPEFGYTDVGTTHVEWLEKTVDVVVNEDIVIPIYAIMYAYPTNTGMTGAPFGTARTQNVTFRIRLSATDSTAVYATLRNYKVLMSLYPTDNGYGIRVYDSDGRERVSSTDVDVNGESPLIVFPDPAKFNVDNYEDSDDT